MNVKGSIQVEKQNENFWSNVPKLTKKEYYRDLSDLGYDPLNQLPIGAEWGKF
jgi:hypothetical protein